MTIDLRNYKGSDREPNDMMLSLVSRENMMMAYDRVVGNGGSNGIDGMGVDELKGYLQGSWLEIKGKLLSGDYEVQGIREVEIPKPQGGVRKLGIPTVLDRMIQQGVHQVLELLFDGGFSESSYGFRRGRSAKEAVLQSREYIREGRRWVVDIDLSKFFDEVNHDRLLSRLRSAKLDRCMIHLIDRYLRAGALVGGVEEKRMKGTPQGSPLSPLLSNIVLDELDKELERRGHKFVRYADDFQIYVKSKRSAERVMESVTKFIEGRMRLKVNQSKSSICRPWETSFLGYSFTTDKLTKLKVSKASLARFKKKLKSHFRMGKGRNLGRLVKEQLNPLIGGWIRYFNYSDTKGFAKKLDQWIRRHLRKIKWQQLKRRWTRFQELMKRGLSEAQAVLSAFNQRGPWYNAGASHMNRAYPVSYFEKLGLLSIETLHRTSRKYSLRTAVIRNRTSGGVRGLK